LALLKQLLALQVKVVKCAILNDLLNRLEEN